MTFELSRRAALRALTAGAAATAVPVTAAHAQEASEPAPRDLTPEQALQLMKDGNAAFTTEAPYRRASDAQRRLEIAREQHPFCVLVGCSDSRVSPELLFGRGLGELFIIRVAGNTVDRVGLGSIEYAVEHLHVPLVLVLGHERCGAVQAAVSVVEDNTMFPGAIGEMVEPIVPAVLRARADGAGEDLVDASVRANVHRVVDRLKSSGEIIGNALAEGKLLIVGARYDLDVGKVEFFDES